MEDVARAVDRLAATASFDQIDELCRSFVEDSRGESPLSIEDYLRRVADGAQPTLLKNLLALDLRRRRAAGQTPLAAEYIGRLPAFAELVRQAFLEASLQSIGTRSMADGISNTWTAPTAAAPVASRLGEYELRRELGRGGMGTVYEAVHLRRGDRVALKTLPTVDGPRLHRFKREFRSLADVNHPNLIGLGAFESDGCHWFFTMDLIEGTDFLSYVRGVKAMPAGASAGGGRLDEARLRSALPQLVAAVMALHGHHIIHRDLKPSNVMVTHDDRLVVLDFGLVMESESLGGQLTSAGQIEGTPRYMAPEQAAGQRVTTAADWYAVGVMLYEALAGRPPFSGPLMQMLQDKQRLDAPEVPTDAGVPADLVRLAMRLLSRDPLERPDARDIAKAISLPYGGPIGARPSLPSRSTLVGRSAQLHALTAAHEAVMRERQPLTVFIRGRSGEGKTSLAEHFFDSVRNREADSTILSGRCYDRESVPFKALDSLIDALCGQLRSLDPTEAALLLPDDVGLLAQLFPVFERVEVVARAHRARPAGLDEQQVRARAFTALRLLLVRLSHRRPIVMFADDLQWGDAGSAEALFEVLRPPNAPAILFVGAFRSDEWESSPFRREWEGRQQAHAVAILHQDVTVSPLSLDECLELAATLLGRSIETIRRRMTDIHAETGGNPFLFIELISCFDPDSDSFRPLPMHEAIDHKLTRLPIGAGKLLDMVAVSGQALPLEDLSKATGHDSPAISTITHMRSERLLRLVGSAEDPLVDTYHDRIRETVLGRMEPPARQGLHLALAETIEQITSITPDASQPRPAGAETKGSQSLNGPNIMPQALPRIYDLAYHFDAAGARPKAAMYALEAATQARRQLALEVAVDQYAVAKRNTEPEAVAARFHLAEQSGETLMLLGRYEAALEALAGAIDLTEDQEQKASVELLQGLVAMRQGLMAKGTAVYESGLRRLGYRVPRTLAGFIGGALRQTMVQAWHTLLPRRLHRERPTRANQLLVRHLNGLAHLYWFRNTVKFMWAHLSSMNRAERYPPSAFLAQNYAAHGVAGTVMGWYSRGARYAAKSISMASACDDKLELGRSYCYKGIALFAAAKYDEGVSTLTEAIETLSKTGDFFEVNLAVFHKACCRYGLGDLAGAIEDARTAFEGSIRIGEDTRAHCAIFLWAKATQGDLPFEQLRSCFRPVPEDILSTDHLLMAEGFWHSGQGRTGKSLEIFEHAYRLAARHLMINFHTAEIFPLLAMALRQHADAVEHDQPREAQRLRRRAARWARWAARITYFFPAFYPHALRELGLALAGRGRTRKALRVLDKSCAVAERQAARYEFARSLLARGKVAQTLERPEARDQIEQAENELQRIESALGISGRIASIN